MEDRGCFQNGRMIQAQRFGSTEIQFIQRHTVQEEQDDMPVAAKPAPPDESRHRIRMLVDASRRVLRHASHGGRELVGTDSEALQRSAFAGVGKAVRDGSRDAHVHEREAEVAADQITIDEDVA